MVIGIDASRNRSGGARAHIIGILTGINDLPEEISEVHIWSYDELLNSLPDYTWLKKHAPQSLKKGIIFQLWWQYKSLQLSAKKYKIDILLNTDAGTVCRFSPAITMSRDMLSYEKGEMKRFGWSLQRLRLLILKYVQNYSLKNSLAAIFLTKYASEVIQRSSGAITNFTIIPHGISENFRINNRVWKNSDKISEPIACVYVSNIAFYKHQCKVAQAITSLKKKGINLTIDFVGGGTGEAQWEFDKCVSYLDPDKSFIKQQDFISHSALPVILSKSDLFIFASSCENMPNTLIEGMCSGIPIACSNRGPMPEVLKNGGVYFDPEDSISIAGAIEFLIRNEKERKEFANRSQILSFQYSWKRCRSETFEYIIDMYKMNQSN